MFRKFAIGLGLFCLVSTQGVAAPITDQIELTGTIEVEAGFASTDDEDTDDISLATMELGADITLDKGISGHFLYAWDEEAEEFEVDEAFITWEKDAFSVIAGKQYVPFGTFETYMISDPLTLDLAETRDTAVTAAFETAGFSVAGYVFNGSADEADEDDRSNTFGASAGYGMETESFSFSAGVDWINHLTESGGLQDALEESGSDLDESTSGVAAHVIVKTGPVCLIGEYVTATDKIKLTTGDELEEISAWAVEVGFETEINEKGAFVAAGVQGSDEAAGMLAEDRYIVACGMDITDGAGIKAEYAHEETGDDDADMFTVQLGLEF